MAIPKPFPLYPGYLELTEINRADYPDLNNLLNAQADLVDWASDHWCWGKSFLEFIGRNKSIHTYIRFRNEVERFLLWSILVHEKPVNEFKKLDVLAYADFCWKPSASWIGTANEDRFIFTNGLYRTNRKWRPFKLQASKSQRDKRVDKTKYRPSQQTFNAMFTAVISFYKHLMNEDLCQGNPAQLAKKDCRHFIADTQVRETKRLTEAQWQYVIDTATMMADTDPLYERHLFIVASLKTLFLRVSELSERVDWSPVMGHFWEDENNNWWLKVYGKGRKLRDVTVPSEYLVYLSRYRNARNLSPLPSSGENTVLVEKIRGQGGMTARHITRLVQEVFDQSYTRMKASESAAAARKLREASSHWLRHTGASMEIENNRPLKDLSEDLGHSSMSTTDKIYVQTEAKKRAESGKRRKV